MISFDMKRILFIDMIKKMVVPTTSSKYLFPTIALTIKPDDNEIEWIGKSKYVTAWVRANCPISTETSEPVQIPIDVSDFLKELKSIKGRGPISFSYNSISNEITIINKKKDCSETHNIIGIPKSAVQGLLNEFPFRLERNTDVILFKNGLVKPNISGSCDVEGLKKFIASVKTQNKMIKSRKDKALLEKIKVMPLTYNIYVDDHQLKIAVGVGKYLVAYSKTSDDILGHGELHYLDGFTEVIKILSGTIKFYAVDNGPLYIMQDSDQMKVRYLIAPAAPYVY